MDGGGLWCPIWPRMVKKVNVKNGERKKVKWNAHLRKLF